MKKRDCKGAVPFFCCSGDYSKSNSLMKPVMVRIF